MTDDFLVEVREKFERAAAREEDNRERAMDDIRFARLGEQWPEKIQQLRDDDNQPCLVKNRLPTFIRQVVNEARQNRPSISVVPNDDNADVATAKIMSGLIRNIEVGSDADVAYDTAVEGAVSGGFGYWRVNTAYSSDDTFDQDIIIERISDPFTVYGDPDADSADGSDWNCAFIVKTMTEADFEKKYKGADKVDFDAEGYSDLAAPWRDGDMVMVAEYWLREEVDGQIIALSNDSVVPVEEYQERIEEYQALGIQPVGQPRTIKKKVTQYILSGAEVLETLEWQGKYIPIVPVYGDEVCIDGERHFKSLITDAKDSQREYNYWSSCAAETIALAPKAPFIGPMGAFNTDIEKWSTANNKSHPFIEYDGPIPPQRQAPPTPSSGELQQAMAAVDDMKAIIGIYDASLGQRSNETSGTAIRARQRQADISTFHFIDNLSRAIRQTGRILLDLIPKVYSTARIIRVLGDDMTPQAVAIAPPEQRQQMQMQIQQRQGEMMDVYDLGNGKYDLVVKAGPSYSTQREYALTEIAEVMRSLGPDIGKYIAPLYFKNADWPGAEDVAALLQQKMQQADQPQGDPQQAQMLQAQMQKMAGDMQRLQMENQQLKAELPVKMQELQVRQMENQVNAQKVAVDGQNAQAKLVGNIAQMRATPANPFQGAG